jgi:HAD superfamily hydrolase (TIGR01484 family)
MEIFKYIVSIAISMDKKGIIFTDLDGTLIFHEKAHGIERLAAQSDGLVRVRDPQSNTEHDAYDLSTQYYTVYIAAETCALAKQLAQQYHIVFMTGARSSTMEARLPVLDFATVYILENGSVIRDNDFHVDQEWADKITPGLSYLEQQQKQLQTDGWNLDIAGRKGMIRVRSKDNPQKSLTDFYDLRDHLELPVQLKKTTNLDNLDILPSSSGKDTAVRYVMQKLGFQSVQTIGIGDDFNDIEVLKITGRQFVPLSAYAEMITQAQASGWYISRGLHFNAANEILKKILYDTNE